MLYNIQPNTLFVGKSLKYLPTCHSTNDLAADLCAKNEAKDGMLVLTSFQSKGRGQRGNIWLSAPDENITMSLILMPLFLEATNQFKLNIAISLAITSGLAKYVATDWKIKWPNDIYVNDKKIGGILIENTIQSKNISQSIIGIGLNINQINFENINATSLLMLSETNIQFQLETVISSILEEIEYYYNSLKEEAFYNLEKEYLANLLRYEVCAKYKFANGKEFLGTIIGIDEIGRLKIEIENQIEVFGFKEVEFIF